jgi:hypothetical protein
MMMRAARTAEMYGQPQQYYGCGPQPSYAPTMQYATGAAAGNYNNNRTYYEQPRTAAGYNRYGSDPRTAAGYYNAYERADPRTSAGYGGGGDMRTSADYNPMFTNYNDFRKSMVSNAGTGALAGVALGTAMMGVNYVSQSEML